MSKLSIALFASLIAFASPVMAQSYPDHPVTIVVGFGPGGPDTNARLLAAQLSSQTGKTFVVENKPGATGLIGAETVAQAAADGYTLLMTPASIASLPAMHKALSFDPLVDFIPISLVSRSEASFLVASPTLDVDSLEELIAYAKDHQVAYSSTGIGTGSHLRMALFAAANGINLTHVPFKSPGEAIASVMNGETHVQFITSSQGLPFVQEGKIKALAFDSDARAPFLLDVPTIVEAGAQPTNLDSGWNGLLAPAGTPPEAIEWLQREVATALQVPEVRSQLESLGLQPVGSTSEDYRAALEKAVVSMGAAVEAAGIEPQ